MENKISRPHMLLLLLAVSVLANAYFFYQNNSLKKRIEDFIPEATKIEQQNAALKTEIYLFKNKITDLSHFKDSVNYKHIPIALPDEVLQYDTIANNTPQYNNKITTPSFRDLNSPNDH